MAHLDDILIDDCSIENNCFVQNTSNIYYNDTIENPKAWNIDMLDEKEDDQFIHPIKKNDVVSLWNLDTGINDQHIEFNDGQIINVDPTFTRTNLSHPHGTGTSICSGGRNYGSSKNFTIYNYPVCRYGGSCGSSDINNGLLAALNYLNQNGNNQCMLQKNCTKRIVINMSFGFNIGSNPINTTNGQYYNGLFKELVNNGAIIITSAGNSNQDACNWLYSFSPYVISVGNIDKYYNRSSTSNWGECVDLYTFGTNIVTGYSIQNNYIIQYKSGTSFSSPLVAGLVANLLHENNLLTQDDIISILYSKVNSLPIVSYNCGNITKKCCRGSEVGTRLDIFCRSLQLINCYRNCIVKNC